MYLVGTPHLRAGSTKMGFDRTNYVLTNSTGPNFCAGLGAEHKIPKHGMHVIFVTFVWGPPPKIIFVVRVYYQHFVLFLC